MKTSMKVIVSVVALGVVAVAGAAWFVRSGVYNIGADDEHTRPVHALLGTLRERSITAGASKVQVPDLSDRTRVAQGAGNYSAMCSGCHLSPGSGPTELSRGLYPRPPDLTKDAVDPAEAFWVIKHGIKASGMPAWGRSMEDDYVWNMVAFLKVLPSLDKAKYQSMVDQSGGHSHGGMEDKPHAHEGPEEAPHSHGHDEKDKPAQPSSDASHPEAKPKAAHTHPPGTKPTTTDQEKRMKKLLFSATLPFHFQ